jgi:hypothetical protein
MFSAPKLPDSKNLVLIVHVLTFDLMTLLGMTLKHFNLLLITTKYLNNQNQKNNYYELLEIMMNFHLLQGGLNN